jgi:hypothetical protein
MVDGEPIVTWAAYCGKPHRTADGLPLAHRCVALPAGALRAAVRGDLKRAARILTAHAAAGRLERHPGVWKLRRR